MRSAVVTVAAVLIGFALAGPAHADGGWAAVAWSHKSGHGAYKGGPGATQASAEQAALAQCGQSDCWIVASDPNCVAVAFDAAGHAQGVTGATEQDVRGQAFAGFGATDEYVYCSSVTR
jgi:hypothetical protein